MKSNRPVNLDLTKFKFPLTAITSIIHRLTGVILFICIPLLLGYLSCSLSSADSFQSVMQSLQTTWGRLISWVIVMAILYHLVAGIRHLFMDIGFGETKTSSKVTAYIMLIVFVILAVLSGVFIW
ncbi:MAG: succinate dehydrogenase, cytochrome b556 subunit [Coxiellaceae bacterium]|nr:succinate dehydrogenase, cytochrome b556 subunit [Coxiellaceae bacterium]MDF1761597.1 succinate dehydrogenase, cytochrome b556 subunit [Coxiellaceae bacterium]